MKYLTLLALFITLGGGRFLSIFDNLASFLNQRVS